jgi:hypothetical protein
MEMQRTTTPISQQVNKELAWNWNGYFGSSFLLHMRVTTFLWNKKKHYEKFQQEKVDDASRMFLLCSFYKSAETTFFSEHKVDDASRVWRLDHYRTVEAGAVEKYYLDWKLVLLYRLIN